MCVYVCTQGIAHPKMKFTRSHDIPNQTRTILFYFILFYFILFYFILFGTQLRVFKELFKIS